ncbi:hypothetical protein ACFL20_04365 [Spirochaetota bacterium]
MSKIDFKDSICRPFCKFFREGEKEEMACQGALDLEILSKKGIIEFDSLPRQGKEPGLWLNRDARLLDIVCKRCDFMKEDCDYHSKSRWKESEPCGGYILLKLLLKFDIIDKGDLEVLSGE